MRISYKTYLAFTSIGALALLGSCVASEPEPTQTLSTPIVGGKAAAAKASAILQLGVGGSCTGTLVAPNLVLTAKHCVTDVIGATYNCDENGNTFVDRDAAIVETTPDAGAFGATRPLTNFSIGPSGTSPFAAHVAEVLVASGATVCKTDIALLLLDRPIDNPTIAPIRLANGPNLGDHLTATGWGFVTGKVGASTLQERDVTVLAVGPTPKSIGDGGPTSGAVPTNFFTVGEALCHGDSGSPALAPSGAVVGVASGVDNPNLALPTSTAADCIGSTVRGIYVTTASEKDFILSGFSKAHASPWLEGEPDPRTLLKSFGASCAADTECKTGVCVPGGDGGSRCSQGCLNDACPDGYQCSPLDNRMRCSPSPQVNTGAATTAPPRSSGCTLSTPHVSNRWLLLCAAGALVCSLRRSRKRGRSVR